MSQTLTFATKLPIDLKEALDRVCDQLGMRKNFIIEMALRAKKSQAKSRSKMLVMLRTC